MEPYLTEIGLQESTDYKRQLPIKAGREKRIYPDYALHYTEKQDYESAKILIEVKYHMKNNKDIEECFKQARSYANILESSVIILCDKNCLIIYKRNNGFDRNNYNKIYWEELKNPDIYNQLRKIIYLK